jgi:hypothetical protein
MDQLTRTETLAITGAAMAWNASQTETDHDVLAAIIKLLADLPAE